MRRAAYTRIPRPIPPKTPEPAWRMPLMKRIFSIGCMTNTDVPLETRFIRLVNDELRRLTGKVKNRFPLNFEFQRLTHDSSIEEEFVGKISSAAVALIIAIAVYFTLFWGYDGLRILTSPSYGLDDVWRSQYIFVIGRLFGLGPIGLIKLAAFFGALKLAVACICAFHIADRIRCWTRGEANSEILEAALILVVAISIASVGPASWANSISLMREHAFQLLFAALATGLCIFERSTVRRAKIAEDAEAKP